MKKYYFDVTKFSNLVENLFKTNINSKLIDYNSLTRENYDKIFSTLNEILSDIKVTNIEKNISPKDKITCLEEQPKKCLEELLIHDEYDVYGHGGAAKEIMKSGEFRCHYSNILSHFVPLNMTNDSLSKLNAWPHRGHDKILIMAIPKQEFNPIYKELPQKNSYDTDKFSISLEYMYGYYDATKKRFYLNDSFKKRHKYNPDNTIYQKEIIGYYRDDDPNVQQLLSTIETIRFILFMTEIRNLDLQGIEEVKNQIIDQIKILKKCTEVLTPEYIINISKVNPETSYYPENDTLGYFNFDTWEEETEHNKIL